MELKLTRKQLKTLEAERERLKAIGAEHFAEQFDMTNPDEELEVIKNLWCEAFWQGALYVTVERAKANHE